MDNNKQNACLTTTLLDEDTGKMILTYVPLHIDSEILDLLLNNSTCDNKIAISFELVTDADKYWQDMWDELKEGCEFDEDY